MTGSESVEADLVSERADSVLLIDVVRAVLDRCGGQRWTVKPEKAWCYVTPPDGHAREHGWKLHVSATPLSAPLVLARVGEVLVKAGCAFKFGTDLRRVSELVDEWCARGAGGKFITVYPKDDDQFRDLAETLHKVTEGLPGPGILSDKQLRPGSLVYYRYGEINGGRRTFTDEGTFKRQMVGPDGTAVTDERNAWFSPPPWAASPFPDELAETPKKPTSVLLGGRYQVRRSIRQANKGGVYRAVDERDGSEVVIKQARAHVGSGLDGTDVRDRLRQESGILQQLQPLGVVPGWVELMQLEEDLFLVQEQIPGHTLETWAQEHSDGPLPASEALKMAFSLVALVEKIHSSGYVIRDLKPANVMVLPDGALRLIDVEFVTRDGAVGWPAGTPRFIAPELRVKSSTTKATAAADCFGLGATLFHAITALSPSWLTRQSGTAQPDTEEILARIASAHPALCSFADLILGLTQPDPEERWTLAQARDWLTARSGSTSTTPAAALSGNWLPDERLDTLIDEQIRQLQTSMNPQAEQLWKQSHDLDVCSLWNGAAGGLSALTHAAAHGDDALRETVASAAAWIDERLFAIPRLLPGLANGRAGTAWALYDAGHLLENPELQTRAIELAGKLPTQWPTPEITLGVSGAGMTHLHLWRATGKPESLDRALACADSVLAAAHRDGDDWAWPIPADYDSAGAGQTAYGFAHGIAGAGAFLLAASQAAEHDVPGSGQRFLQAALGAGDTLVRATVTGTTGALWPRSTSDPGETENGMYWCSGAAGIGSFLIRLWAATQEQRFADYAEQAAATVAHNPWPKPPGACCGLSGAGHFLLDMADHTSQDIYRNQARAIAAVIDTRTTTASRSPGKRDPDYCYQSGIAGILRFHLRLRHGGPHPWIPEHV
ncbi:class IV lanthionine synthetase LanL [Streptomyces sp. NPDC056534]|uniref:class IV lanthionine synthetase LanL n=1 Tax=Streptomyces sp. NPDC056534 TaxID=3345857 RepID=UPI0036C0F710